MQAGALGFAIANLATIGPEVLAAAVNHQDGILLGGLGLDAADNRDQEEYSGNGRNFNRRSRSCTGCSGRGSAFFCSNFRSRIPKRLLPFQLRRSTRRIGLSSLSFKHKIG